MDAATMTPAANPASALFLLFHALLPACFSLLPAFEQSGSSEHHRFRFGLRSEDRHSRIYQFHLFVSHITKLLRKGLHVSVQLRLHVIMQCEDAAFFQDAPAFQKQFLLIGSHNIVINIVADDRIHRLIRHIQISGVAPNEGAAVSDAFQRSVLLTQVFLTTVYLLWLVLSNFICDRTQKTSGTSFPRLLSLAQL